MKRDEDDSYSDYIPMEDNVDGNERNGDRDQENAMNEFSGICKQDPNYAAEKGLKCFMDHNLCR